MNKPISSGFGLSATTKIKPEEVTSSEKLILFIKQNSYQDANELADEVAQLAKKDTSLLDRESIKAITDLNDKYINSGFDDIIDGYNRKIYNLHYKEPLPTTDLDKRIENVMKIVNEVPPARTQSPILDHD